MATARIFSQRHSPMPSDHILPAPSNTAAGYWTPQLLVSPKFSQWRIRPPACARPGPRICLAEFTPSKAGLAPQRTGSRKSARWLAVVLLTRSGSPSASYGEQARVHLTRARQLSASVRSGDQEASRRYGRKVSAAVYLYAQQASRGSFSGEQSLRFIAIELAKSKPLLESAVEFPNVQHLLAAYLVPRLHQLAEAVDTYGDDDARSAVAIHEQSLVTVLNALRNRRPGNLEGAHIFAALAYRAGAFRLAGDLAAQSNDPLSHWVQAKLAIRAGLPAEADAHLGIVMSRFRSTGQLESYAKCMSASTLSLRPGCASTSC